MEALQLAAHRRSKMHTQNPPRLVRGHVLRHRNDAARNLHRLPGPPIRQAFRELRFPDPRRLLRRLQHARPHDLDTHLRSNRRPPAPTGDEGRGRADPASADGDRDSRLDRRPAGRGRRRGEEEERRASRIRRFPDVEPVVDPSAAALRALGSFQCDWAG